MIPHRSCALAIASGLHKDEKFRWQIAEKLLAHAEDADDQNLPLMYWYAIEPLADVDPARALALALNGKIPQLHGYMIRRIGAGEKAMNLLIDALAKTPDAGQQLTFLTALREVAQRPPAPCRCRTPGPRCLASCRTATIRSRSHSGRVSGGGVRQPEAGSRNGENAAAAPRPDGGHQPRCSTPAIPSLRRNCTGCSIRSSKEPRPEAWPCAVWPPMTIRQPPNEILRRFPDFTAEERIDALNTLAARPTYAKTAAGRHRQKADPASDVSADIVRQTAQPQNKDISKPPR